MTQRLLAHNAWATRVLLERCRSLTPQQFQQRFDIGPGSLHDTLRHIIGAMLRWSDRIADRTVRTSIEKNPNPSTVDELMALLDQADSQLGDSVALVGRDGREHQMMQAEFSPARFTRGSAIAHVVTHGMHHRAQATNMFRRLGITELPELDVIEWELAAMTR